MTSYILYTEHEREDAMGVLAKANLPCTFTLDIGADRSIDQNSLLWKWYGEICDQLREQSPQELHNECKLTIGVPIIRAYPTKAQRRFCAVYEKHLAELSYEDQLDFIAAIPVTSIMSTSQMTKYLNELHKVYTIKRGCVLTEPR